jgi:hypothetical protein
MMDDGAVSLENFLIREHEQSYGSLMHMDNMLSTYFWLYVTLVVAITAVDGIIVGLSGVGPNTLIFISISSLVLLVVGLAILQMSLHMKDRQNLLSAYVQEIVFYFMGKGLKPIAGSPRNKEAARILDFKHIFDDSHINDWHLRRRKHIQGYGSPDEAGDAWTSGYSMANKMMFFFIVILSGLVAFTIASLASGVMLGNSSAYETSFQSGQHLYFGIVLGMEFFVASLIFFRYILKNRMKAKREFADNAFRRKKEAWFAGSSNPRKVQDMIESTISKSRSVSRAEGNPGEEAAGTEGPIQKV